MNLEPEVTEEMLREFLAVGLMCGGKFSAFSNTVKDPVDDWLKANKCPFVFDPAQGRDLLNFVEVDGELDYYEVTQEGMDFVGGWEMKSERERSIEFLLGWMMEFGSQPVSYAVFYDSPWWVEAVAELHQPRPNKEIAGCFDKDNTNGTAWMNENGRKLLEEV